MNPEQEHPLNVLTKQVTEEERKKQVYTQRALRTLEGDIQEAIQERNASTASMVMAEQAKLAASAPAQNVVKKHQPSNTGKKLLIFISSIMLIIVGIGGAYYLYLKSPLAPSAPAAPAPVVIPSIVLPDVQKVLDITGLSQESEETAIENALSNVANKNNYILQIVPVEKNSSGTENIVNASDFLASIGLPAPDVLFRSLDNQWMIGTFNDNGTAAPFVILTDNFFQNAYAGMISWEKTMPDNFANIFGYAGRAAEQKSIGPDDLPVSTASSSYTSTSSQPIMSSSSAPSTVASSTSTSSAPSFTYTQPLSSYFTINGSWSDGVIENKDVRVFTATNGNILLLYSFVDNNTIVITTDENALAEIISRLENQSLTR